MISLVAKINETNKAISNFPEHREIILITKSLNIIMVLLHLPPINIEIIQQKNFSKGITFIKQYKNTKNKKDFTKNLGR